MVADAAGCGALYDLAEKDSSVMDQAQVLLVAPEADAEARMKSLQPRGLHIAPDLDAAGPLFRQLLGTARMGTQLFLAGSEGLMGALSALAVAEGLPLDAMQMEHRGTVARRMQCVHCKGVTDNVTTDPFTCSHCGLTLFVRDHFSRRLGAFQGVCVDAETPGEIPDTVEIRP
ncbi:MAG: dimethylamine monooxygenase subunit DmmA family protein [Pseudomonadota bacterium]|nr:dimethylamine monooxygenase subunit DmmA family protein [Pseudomonadota bacterium]